MLGVQRALELLKCGAGRSVGVGVRSGASLGIEGRACVSAHSKRADKATLASALRLQQHLTQTIAPYSPSTRARMQFGGFHSPS